MDITAVSLCSRPHAGVLEGQFLLESAKKERLFKPLFSPAKRYKLLCRLNDFLCSVYSLRALSLSASGLRRKASRAA